MLTFLKISKVLNPLSAKANAWIYKYAGSAYLKVLSFFIPIHFAQREQIIFKNNSAAWK